MTTTAPAAPAAREAAASRTSSRGAPDLTLSEYDIYLFKQGTHGRLYERLGGHLVTTPHGRGAQFGVWAPNAASVSVIGDFNHWNPAAHPLRARDDSSGVWEGFVPGARAAERYKYHLVSRADGRSVDKSDPFAFCCETPPRTASCLWSLDHVWGDAEWMARRGRANALDAPQSIYEVHLGSWRPPDHDGGPVTYAELGRTLADYAVDMGFTHVELMPVTEHPFYGSWGYQTTGYFAPTTRYGTPQQFMAMIDHLHQRGLGVILDWVPSHFPNDEHGLATFDGTHLFEHADRRQGFHPEWRSHIFNYGRHEVRAFLTSSALFWLDKYHIDGLRVDGVASMLYLDYARKPGEWVPNEHGGHENLGAVTFLRQLNETVYREYPDTQTIAEESTSWPQVSRPVYLGGLGFGLKWNMGWMHDTLDYFHKDPIHRRHHQGQLTFSLWYAFSENFALPLSHDEVVHGKGSLINKMPGDAWQQFANLRALFGYMWAHPGKKMLFMGGEFGQRREWQHESFLEWFVLAHAEHAGVRDWVRDLNRYYRATPALHARDFDPAGFEWIDCGDASNSVLSFIRKPADGSGERVVLVVCNLTPVPRLDYAVGAPCGGWWRETLNSDAGAYGGSGMGNYGGVNAVAEPVHGRPWSLRLTLPPLSVVFFESES